MGRTPTPLKIVVPDTWIDLPYFKDLRAKGHQVEPSLDAPLDFDILFHPRAHACPEAMLEKPALMEAALKRARASRKTLTPGKSSGKSKGKSKEAAK